MSKCDFNKVAMQLDWNHTVNLMHIFKKAFSYEDFWRAAFVPVSSLFDSLFIKLSSDSPYIFNILHSNVSKKDI